MLGPDKRVDRGNESGSDSCFSCVFGAHAWAAKPPYLSQPAGGHKIPLSSSTTFLLLQDPRNECSVNVIILSLSAHHPYR